MLRGAHHYTRESHAAASHLGGADRLRGVRHTAAPLRPRRLNVLIGPNNSGKTTVIDALSLLPHPSALCLTGPQSAQAWLGSAPQSI
ncbi:MAG: hypothetical protein DRJ56_00420 [Thermoprotei archaeon]|nr:MAG: hypothetical protein DRJ56_00420 [Thermoprotei archaeon]